MKLFSTVCSIQLNFYNFQKTKQKSFAIQQIYQFIFCFSFTHLIIYFAKYSVSLPEKMSRSFVITFLVAIYVVVMNARGKRWIIPLILTKHSLTYRNRCSTQWRGVFIDEICWRWWVTKYHIDFVCSYHRNEFKSHPLCFRFNSILFCSILGNLTEVRRLVAAGVDVNIEGNFKWTPLHAAASEGKTLSFGI